jgi:hypothetical protein
MRNHPEDESEFQLEFTDDIHKAQLLAALNTMRKNRHFCDVILHVCALTVEHHILRVSVNRVGFKKKKKLIRTSDSVTIDRSSCKIGIVYGQLHYWVLSSRHN